MTAAVVLCAWCRGPLPPGNPSAHAAVLHDVHDFDDERPRCCVDGCRCGESGGNPVVTAR